MSGRASSDINMPARLAQYALPRNIAQIEFRQALSDHHSPTLKTASWLCLRKQMEDQMCAFSPNLRRKISKGKRNGFVVIWGGAELLHDFWLVYARHLDKLGSVAIPERFFANLLKGYTNGQASVFLIYHNNSIAGGAFNLAYQGFYENGWFATLHKHQKHYASYVLHHAMIEHAIHLHCHTYSFGRSTTGSGVHRFKQQWGARDIPLLWSQFPAQKLSLRKHTWLSRCWNLLPWTFRKYGGRYLAKWIY